ATIAKATGLIASEQITAGTKILLRKGNTFTTQTIYFSKFKGTIENPITFGAYGSGNKPIITNLNPTEVIFYFSDMPETSKIVLDGLYFYNTGSGPTIMSYYWGGLRKPNIAIKNSEIEGGYDAIQIQTFCGSLLIENSIVHGAQHQGLLAGCSNITITGTEFFNNGQSDRDHNIYLSGEGGSNILIENSNLHDTISCFIAHGTKNSITMRGNRVHNCNFGISIDAGYASAEKFENIIIENNKISDQARYNPVYGTWGLALGSCINCIVRNNVFANNSDSSISVIGGNIEDSNNDGIYVYNNTFYNNAVESELLYYSNKTKNIFFKNNLVYNSSQSSRIMYQFNGTQPEISTGNNLYFFTNNPSRDLYSINGTAYTYSEFKAAFPGQETNSIFGLDPKFAGPSNPDGSDGIIGTSDDGLMPQSDSPAINAGETISEVQSDIRGVSRPQGAGYDIGAYEYSAG
ncbi:MAG: choice-of-anchor Q domain-containing protein, partial [Candidatus ainarchaeum sp.]|nr:choice-of-anchor Q domain-containing protein [Candidatus ainarchaeum sp.]